MRLSLGFVGFLGCAVASGCSSKMMTAPPLADCVDPSCAAGHGSGGSGGQGSSVTDAGSEVSSEASSASTVSVDVTFSVGVTNDKTFKTLDPWSDLVTVSAFDTSGRIVTSAAGVEPGSVLAGVASGPNWFAVQDASGKAAGFTATLEPVTVDPVLKTAFLAGLRTSDLTRILIDTVQWAPLQGTATVLLIFTQNSNPLRGVTLSPATLPSQSSVAYDTGVLGSYSTMAAPPQATGAVGTALVYEIPSPQAFPEVTRITFGATVGSKSFPIDAVVARDFVTWLVIEVP